MCVWRVHARCLHNCDGAAESLLRFRQRARASAGRRRRRRRRAFWSAVRGPSGRALRSAPDLHLNRFPITSQIYEHRYKQSLPIYQQIKCKVQREGSGAGLLICQVHTVEYNLRTLQVSLGINVKYIEILLKQPLLAKSQGSTFILWEYASLRPGFFGKRFLDKRIKSKELKRSI